MRHFIASLTLFVLVAAASHSTSIHAADSNKSSSTFGDGKSYKGKVSVQKIGEGKFAWVKITANGVAYNLTLDALGIQVGKEYEGIDCEVQGTVTDKKGVKWITVIHIGEVPPSGKKKKKKNQATQPPSDALPNN